MSMYPDQVRSNPLSYSSEREFPMARFFNQVYAWMCVGLAVTGLVAYVGSQTPALWPILANKGVMVAAALGLFGLSMATQSVALRVSAAAGLAMFLLYAAILGVLLSGIFVIYPAATIFGAFIITAGGFGAVGGGARAGVGDLGEPGVPRAHRRGVGVPRRPHLGELGGIAHRPHPRLGLVAVDGLAGHRRAASAIGRLQRGRDLVELGRGARGGRRGQRSGCR